MQTPAQSATVINADGLILGRMATYVAKRLLKGEEVVVINAEKAVLSGKKRSKVEDAKQFLQVGAPERGPFHYKRPDRIVRKSIRGMLPYKRPKGKQAFRRLKVYMGVPVGLKEQKAETLSDAQAHKLKCPHLTVGEFAKELGWNPGE